MTLKSRIGNVIDASFTAVIRGVTVPLSAHSRFTLDRGRESDADADVVVVVDADVVDGYTLLSLIFVVRKFCVTLDGRTYRLT